MVWKRNAGKTYATLERIVVDRLDTVSDCDAFKAPATPERRRTNRHDAVSNSDVRETCAYTECSRADRFNLRPKLNILDFKSCSKVLWNLR